MNDQTKQLLEMIDACGPRLQNISYLADRENRLVHENINFLREQKLVGASLPVEIGGLGLSIGDCALIVSRLAKYCLSTAICYGMHLQQVYVIAASDFQDRDRVLEAICRNQSLVASVTTDHSNRGLLSKNLPSISDMSGKFRLQRAAPMVSYIDAADYFLITVGLGVGGRCENGLCLVEKSLCGTSSVDLVLLGMKGTGSKSVNIDAVVERCAVLQAGISELMNEFMIPVGHILWSAAWFGAAQGAYFGYLSHLRSKALSEVISVTKNEDNLKRVARLRLDLDLMSIAIENSVTAFGNKPCDQNNISKKISINNLKIFCAERAEAIVDDICSIIGFFGSYLESEGIPLARVRRDIMAAKMMFNNDTILKINGKLAFAEVQR
jgi:acyl-CoA dehydrogenase